MVDKFDIIILTLFAVLVAIYYNRDFLKDLFFNSSDKVFKLENGSGSRDIVTVLKENNKNFLVVYGSQTGTAEDYAKKFAKELMAKFKLNVMCVDLEDYDFDNLTALPSNIMISIFLSTYGEGDYPDNALLFETWLKSLDQIDSSLKNINFTMFGLGNSTYEHFNGAAKSALKLLKENGANLIGDLGLADDGAGTTDEDYLSWNEKIVEKIKVFLKVDEQDLVFQSSFEINYLDNLNDKVFLGEPSSQYLSSFTGGVPFNKEKNLQTGPFNINYPYVAPIVKSIELFDPLSGRNCIHTEFDVSGSNMKYSTGDHLAVWPSNSDEAVATFLRAFNLKGDKIFDITLKDPTMKLPFPTPTTIESTVRYYLEITGPVSRQFIRSLVQFAPDDIIKSKLLELSNDKDQFVKEIISNYFNVADALLYISDGEPWTTVSWDFIIESIPRLLPRYYSISSSALNEKQTIHITSIVENNRNDKVGLPPVVGVTTNLLRNIQLDRSTVSEGAVSKSEAINPLPVHYNLDGPRNLFHGYKLPVHVRKSTFRLPTNPQTPVIMIGPGTGVAPFRGFIRERVRFQELNPNVKLGKHLLFYGSRDLNDFLYRDEWEQYKQKLNGSFEMVVAHSRLPNQPKVYVQDKVKEREDEILKLLQDGAFVYICGDAKGMAKDTHSTFVGIYSRGLNIGETEAHEIIKMLKSQGKYQEDVW